MGQCSLEIAQTEILIFWTGVWIWWKESFKKILSILRSLLQEITFHLLIHCYFYKQKEMVIACIMMGCTSETDIITQWIRHYINQNFKNRQIWHVASRALKGVVPSQCERLTSIIVSNIFSCKYLRERNHFPFIGCHFHVSEYVASSLQVELSILI